MAEEKKTTLVKVLEFVKILISFAIGFFGGSNSDTISSLF